MAFKVAVIGTHGTGKTTILNDINTFFSSQSLNVGIISELARVLLVNINDKTSVQDQLVILNEQIVQEKQHEDKHAIICDRSVLDNYCYLKFHYGKEHPEAYQQVLNHLPSYDLLLVTSIDPMYDLVKDGTRSEDKQFQEKIQELVLEELGKNTSLLENNNVSVFFIKSSNEAIERIKEVLQND